MAEPKTTPTSLGPAAYLAGITDPARRRDCEALARLLADVDPEVLGRLVADATRRKSA